MAGIGFELRKVISRGGLSSSFNAALSGILIVAGPWLLTVLTIFFIRQFFESTHMQHGPVFQAVVVYSYALSLSLFSGIHYLFTRLTADLLWENRQREGSLWLIRFIVFTAIASALGAGIPLAFLPLEGVPDPWLVKAAAVSLFVAVNLIWVLMLFISLLRWYFQIMLVYLVGMAGAVVLVFLWGKSGGLAGALFGFAAGHGFIIVLLLIMSLVAYPPVRPPQKSRILGTYVRKYSFLIFSGFFFYLAQWADKFFFWFTQGAPVEGTFFRLFDAYDLPVYWSGLSIIPGLVYFVIFSETGFYFSLQKFLHATSHGTYKSIQLAKYNMIRTMNSELRNQSLFQGLFTVVASFIAAWLFEPGPLLESTLITLWGAFLQLFLMTLLNFFYYFELYAQAFLVAGLFLVGNGILAPVAYLFEPLPPGLGYTLSLLVSCIVGFWVLAFSVRTIDRRIFLKALL